MKGMILKLDNVYFKYEEQIILENINLSVIQGDFVAILGPNGSGKTTLLKIILGLIKPTLGKVEIFNKTKLGPKDFSKIGYVPQKATHFNHRFPATVAEIVSTGLYSTKGFIKFLNKTDKREISKNLEIVGLKGYENKRINSLSGGQQQKVFIARALSNKPQLLILDEPTTGLDCQSQEMLYSFLEMLNKRFNLTILMVSHDVGVVSSKINKVACLNRKLLFHGNPKELSSDKFSKIYGEPLIPLIHHA